MDSTNEILNSDKPISNKAGDIFQRFPFAQRIAESIMNSQSTSSITYAVYGAWGEGKTSVLNMIKDEIEQKHNDVIQIVFNPWIFANQITLMNTFFELIYNQLYNASQTRDSNFIMKRLNNIKKIYKNHSKSKKEKICSALSYLKILQGIPVAGEIVKGVTEFTNTILSTSIEDARKRFEEFLIKQKRRIVIYIDDIDRLDKNEIYMIFKLVKLTSDFPYISFVLAFDREMVASALADKYGMVDNNKSAGINFLEKIIQVPLYLPRIQSNLLNEFCYKLINNALSNANITIEQNDIDRFNSLFPKILPKINTPRLANILGNSLMFVCPILKNEVNITDLILIESIKLFYPEYYQYIWNHESFFIDKGKLLSLNNSELELIKNGYDKLVPSLSEIDKLIIQYLLKELFPKLQEIYDNRTYDYGFYDIWYKEKRITSLNYFAKYFIYTTPNNTIAESEFDELLLSIKTNTTIDSAITIMKVMLVQNKADTLLMRLRSNESELTWLEAKKLIEIICNIADGKLLSKNRDWTGIFAQNSFEQAAILIYQLFKNHRTENEIFEFAKKMLSIPPDLNFSFELLRWLKTGDRDEDKLFSTTQYEEMSILLAIRTENLATEYSFIEKFPNLAQQVLFILKQTEETNFKANLMNYLNRDNYNILNLLRCFVPIIISSSKENPYYEDFTKENYNSIKTILSSTEIYDRVVKIYTQDEIEQDKTYWVSSGIRDFSDINMVRQFLTYYNAEAIMIKE